MVTQYRLSCEALAQKLLEEEWDRMEGEKQRQARVGRSTPRVICLPHWLLPELLQLLTEAQDRPLGELEPIVREIVAEQQFIDVSGGPVIGDREGGTTDLHVDVFMRVLERLRHYTLDTGTWSNVPITPQMFG